MSAVIPEHLQAEFDKARAELGDNEYFERLSVKFGKPVLNFARSMVINLPGDCYADCWYCIDRKLRRSVEMAEEKFLETITNVVAEFPEMFEVAITGGTVTAPTFNHLIRILRRAYPEARITYNTHGANLTDEYAEGIEQLTYINLHRNAIDDKENQAIFKSSAPIIPIDEAKELFGDKLYLRVTIDKDFNLDDYLALGIPLYLNKLLPGNLDTNEKFEEVMARLDDKRDPSIRRRNQYLNKVINGTPVRVCVGDELATHIPNRHPVFLNVVIVHRSGVVGGSWFEDDKVLTGESTQKPRAPRQIRLRKVRESQFQPH